MKRILFYGLFALLLFFLALIIIPINPRLTKSQIQRLKSKAEISQIAVGIEKYKATYQVYPFDDGHMLWKQLSGDNPQRIVFALIKADFINTNGDFLDPWHMPYSISFTDTNIFIITSAGKDKFFATKDDIIFNSVSNDFVKP